MGIISFKKKLTSIDLCQIKVENYWFKFYDQDIKEIEICGSSINVTDKYVDCCDFNGEFSFFKTKDLQIPTGSVCFILRPFQKNEKINFFCKSASKITIYQEIVFNLEINEMKNQKCYYQ